MPGVKSDSFLPRIFALCLGLMLGVALLKFGNPPILEKWTTPPTNIWEFVFASPWPIVWGHMLLGGVAVLGFLSARWKWAEPRWLTVVPLAWLGWQALAARASLDAALSWPTVTHFATCIICFYLGLFALRRLRSLWPFWCGLLGAFVLVLLVGWDQHLRGLEETRRYFYLYIYPQLKDPPPELLKKM